MNNSSNSAVAGVFEDQAQAERAVADLRSAGFTEDQIGYAVRGTDGDGATTVDTNRGDTGGGGTSDPDARGGTREGGVMGAITGASFGSIVGVAAAMLLPGVGPIVAGGILGAALSGAAIGAATGGLFGAMREWGFSEEEATYYQGEFESGRTIVTVRADGRQAEARAILQRNGGYDSTTRSATTTTATTTTTANLQGDADTTTRGTDVLRD
jgi:hypothetical protein